MRTIVAACVLLATAGTVRADAPCHVAVELRGAIADGTTTMRLDPTDQTSSRELFLPDGGKLVDVSLRGAGSSVAVSTAFASQMVTDASALGADPAIALQLADREIRVVLQPVGKEQTLVPVTMSSGTCRPSRLARSVRR